MLIFGLAQGCRKHNLIAPAFETMPKTTPVTTCASKQEEFWEHRQNMHTSIFAMSAPHPLLYMTTPMFIDQTGLNGCVIVGRGRAALDVELSGAVLFSSRCWCVYRLIVFFLPAI